MRGKEVVVLSAAPCSSIRNWSSSPEPRRANLGARPGRCSDSTRVGAAAEGEIRSLRLTTRKPRRGLIGAPGIEGSGVDLEGLTEPVRVFAGTAREAARDFPANLNVAVALALAGPGHRADGGRGLGDPGVTKNTHTIVLKSDVADLTMTIENVPSENPRTGASLRSP